MKSLEARGLASNSNRPQPSPSGLGGLLLLGLPPMLLCCPGPAGTGPSPSPPRKTRKRDAEEKGTEQSVLSSGVDSSHALSQGRVWGPGQQGGGIFDDFPVFRWQPTWPAPCSLPAWVAGDLGLRGCGGGGRGTVGRGRSTGPAARRAVGCGARALQGRVTCTRQRRTRVIRSLGPRPGSSERRPEGLREAGKCTPERISALPNQDGAPGPRPC